MNAKDSLSQPAPQGVAEVMQLVDDYGKRVVRDQEHDCIDDREAKRRLSCIEWAVASLVQERDALRADNRLLHSGQLDLVNRITELEVNYYELLHAVAHKHPDETRHQTALRYIMRAEKAHGPHVAGAASSKEPSHD